MTGLALVVMETLNTFFFFWLPLMLLASVHTKANSEEAGNQYEAVQLFSPSLAVTLLKFTGSIHVAV